ncbi:MAG: nuclear transport factor 2 family protein [Bradyrhizobium sp.]|jgi:ketosteroid isomerase-like protein
MTLADAEEFVTRFAAAWAARDSEMFLRLWWPEGKLHYPFASRVIRGDEIGMLNELTKGRSTDLKWFMVDWTARGDVIVVEWESTSRLGERVLSWRGVDKLTLRDGRIIEEVVYADTAPLQALRRGETFEALIPIPD